MKKQHIDTVTEFNGSTIRTFKSDFKIYKMEGGQYFIGLHNDWNERIYGGDSACEDHYDLPLMKSILANWNGILNWDGEKYSIEA
jgi:hypothetical protein